MLLADVVATSQAVAATRSRKAKVVALAETLGRAGDEIETVTSYLAGSLRQRRTGLGWRSMQSLPAPPRRAVADRRRGARGVRPHRRRWPGPARRRPAPTRWPTLFGRATADEQQWLARLVTGEVRQGALDSLVQEGLAVAGGVPLAAVRRAAMMAGSTVAVASAALTGGEEALAGVRARGRPTGAADARLERDLRRGGAGQGRRRSRCRSTPSSTASGSRCTGGTTR